LRGGRATAVQLTFVKVLAMVCLAIAILVASHGLADVSWAVRTDARMLSVYGMALIPVLYTYEGWSYLAFAAGEVRDPARNIPRAFVLGIGCVIGIYLLVNLAYLSAQPVEVLRGTLRVGAAAAT